MSSEKEKLIIEMSSYTGYDPEVIELIYDFTNGDRDGINKIISTIHKNILLIKANIESKAIERKGFMYIAYDISRNEIIEKGLFVFKTVDEVNLLQAWEGIRKIIYGYKSEAKYDRNMANAFDKEFGSDVFLKEIKRLSTELINNPKFITQIEALILKALASIFYNKNFQFDMKTDMLDPFLFFKPMDKKDKQEEEEETRLPEQTEDDDTIVRLKVYPVLDPIGGKPVKEIFDHERVLFEMKDEREAASYIADLIKKGNEDTLIGRIINYTYIDQDTIRLNIMFVPGIGGEALVNNAVRLKTLDNQPQNPGKLSPNRFDRLSKVPTKPFITVMLIIIAVIILYLVFSK